MRPFLLCCLLLASLTTFVAGFVHPATVKNVHLSGSTEAEAPVSFSKAAAPLCPPLSMAKLGDDDNTRVDIFEVDAFTLTSIGFGLIAFNFLVLANMGDIGIGGFVARIMNTFG